MESRVFIQFNVHIEQRQKKKEKKISLRVRFRTNIKKPWELVTARKRSLRRLCFYTCLSFCSQGGVHGERGVVHGEGGVRGEGGGVHGKWGACVAKWGACVVKGGMCGRGCLWWVAGGGHAWYAPSPILRDTVDQCAGGTHPTGMHSCLH